jgi:hypothetical protein
VASADIGRKMATAMASNVTWLSGRTDLHLEWLDMVSPCFPMPHIDGYTHTHRFDIVNSLAHISLMPG